MSHPEPANSSGWGAAHDVPQPAPLAIVSSTAYARAVAALVEQGRRLGFDLARGAIAICAVGDGARERLEESCALVAQLAAARVVGLVPMVDERTAERETAAL